MRSCAIHVHKHSVEAMLLQQCREVTTVILSITPWLPAYMGQSLIRCNSHDGARTSAETAPNRAPKWRPTLSRDGTPNIAERAPQSSPNLPQDGAQNRARHSSPARYSDRHSVPDTVLGILLDTLRKQLQMAVEAAVTPSRDQRRHGRSLEMFKLGPSGIPDGCGHHISHGTSAGPG